MVQLLTIVRAQSFKAIAKERAVRMAYAVRNTAFAGIRQTIAIIRQSPMEIVELKVVHPASAAALTDCKQIELPS